jgi:hypothetical protein
LEAINLAVSLRFERSSIRTIMLTFLSINSRDSLEMLDLVVSSMMRIFEKDHIYFEESLPNTSLMFPIREFNVSSKA